VREGAAGQAHTLGDLRHRADVGEGAVLSRDEQDAIGLADVGGQGDRHAGEDDRVVEGQEDEVVHVGLQGR
jgi:hypothetical protein